MRAFRQASRGFFDDIRQIFAQTPEARAFEQHRPQDAAAELQEVTRLSGLYRAGSAHIKGQPGLIELWRFQRQVEGGQLEEAESVVGDHHLDGGLGQLPAQLGQLYGRRRIPRVPRPIRWCLNAARRCME